MYLGVYKTQIFFIGHSTMIKFIHWFEVYSKDYFQLFFSKVVCMCVCVSWSCWYEKQGTLWDLLVGVSGKIKLYELIFIGML